MDKPNIGLLVMPNLIVDYILNLLGQSDILTLRLTCKTTNYWLTQKLLDKLAINIPTKSAYISITNSQTLWTNFNFQLQIYSSRKLLSHFLYLYNDSIRTLKFTFIICSPFLTSFLVSCSNLKTLSIRELDCSTMPKLSPVNKYRLSLTCSRLQSLSIQDISSNDKSGGRFFIQELLSSSFKSLKQLSIPILTFPFISAYPLKYMINYENLGPTSPTDILVIKPLVEMLENSINLNLEAIVVIPESRSSISDASLSSLSLLCYNRKINLVYDNLSDTNYPLRKLNYTPSIEPSMPEIASKILTVMGSTTDLLLNFEFNNLRKLKVQFSTFNITQDIFVVQNFPRLNTIQFDFSIKNSQIPTRAKVRRMNMFVQGVLEVSRPKVNHLVVQSHNQVAKYVLIPVAKIVYCFANLTSLSLNGYGGNAKDFEGLWMGLTKLEKVEVENCSQLGDKGILGVDWMKPAILRLTNLQELSISKCGRITDLSYFIAFGHLKLTRFHHTPLYPSDVSREGYGALLEGDFRKSIKFLSGSTTNFGRTSRHELREFLDDFPNLIGPSGETVAKSFRRWNGIHCFGIGVLKT